MNENDVELTVDDYTINPSPAPMPLRTVFFLLNDALPGVPDSFIRRVKENPDLKKLRRYLRHQQFERRRIIYRKKRRMR